MEDRPEDTRNDENEDVEGHSHHAPKVGAPKVGREDEGDDDVEAHSNFGAPKVG